jgi:signal transduction histidine kinase/AmiR/NasT family two-component response regulator
VLLSAALSGRRGTALVLKRTESGSTLVFDAGRAPHGAQALTVNLHNGSTLEVLGAVAGSGIFRDTAALVVLVGGIIVSLLLGMLVLVLATGRARAMRLVDKRTRELADEARVSASARDDAVQASNEKSVFVATVSHELRTPLAGVIGTAELLSETKLDAEQQEFVEIVRSSSEGLLLVINDILDYSKMEAGKLELDPIGFALSELIAESCALVLPSAHDKGLEVEVDVDKDLPGWLEGDGARIRQVLINLLSNAVKFTPKGRVTVHASSTPTTTNMSLIRIAVTDTGIGIDEETLARLFQPFTQADNSTARTYGGTGLGLTISAQLVERMGGTISAQSVPGEGSTFAFELELPLADRSERTVRMPAKFEPLGERDAAGNLSESAPLVLVAEDNPVNQMLAARLLDRCGYRSEVVANGNEVLEATAHNAYAAILMDCQMPELDGYDATRAIRRRETPPAHIPIIATTAHSMSGDREKCLEAGMDDYVSKPIRAGELSNALMKSIGASNRSQRAASATVASDSG